MRRLAWGLFALWVVLAAVAGGLSTHTEDQFDLLFMIGLSVFAVVGAVIASRQPHNPIGWILQAVVLLAALTAVVAGYTTTADDPWPFLVWLDDWIADVWIGLIGVAPNPYALPGAAGDAAEALTTGSACSTPRPWRSASRRWWSGCGARTGSSASS